MSDRRAKQSFSGGRVVRSGRGGGVRGESEYRVRLVDEDRRQLALDLAELLKGSEGEKRSFGTLAEDWLKRLVRVRPKNERLHVRHMEALFLLKEGELTRATIEACFVRLDVANGGPLGPATLNKLRSTGKLIIDDARAIALWRGPNPFTSVKPRRVPRKPWPRLTREELVRAFEVMRPDRRREAVVALLTGMRPGEMKALQKQDVDLERGMISVHRSLGRNQTKTGMPREVPIPRAARAAVEEAIRISKSELVFPKPDGTRQRDDTKLSRVLRTAFKKAGVVLGYRLTCRRKDCAHEEQHAAPLEIVCPKCGMRLWAEPIPKPFTWYSLRHAAATLHREAGADALAVKMALGHVARDVTDDVYTHISDDRYRAELNRLALPEGKVHLENCVDTPSPSTERRMGFEPTTLSLGSSGSGGPEALGRGSNLLTVRDVAELLSVSDDTVYRLVWRGRLPAVRVGTCLRFQRFTLADFVEHRGATHDTDRGAGDAEVVGSGAGGAEEASAGDRKKLH